MGHHIEFNDAMFAAADKKAEPAAPVAVTPAPKAKSKPVVESELKPGELIKMARKRLRDVTKLCKAATKELKQLEKEREQLSRLLDAADGKQLALVHSIQQKRAQ